MSRSTINLVQFPVSGTSLGSGESIFQGINPANTLNFKNLNGSSGIAVSADTNNISISYTGSSSSGSDSDKWSLSTGGTITENININGEYELGFNTASVNIGVNGTANTSFTIDDGSVSNYIELGSTNTLYQQTDTELSIISVNDDGDVSLIISANDGQLIIDDNRLNPTGIEYTTDLSAYFVKHSLIDKHYVTGLTSMISGGSVTANNGLTKTGSNIYLGGTLTGNTTIEGNTNTYDLLIQDTNLFRVVSTDVHIEANVGQFLILGDASDIVIQPNASNLVLVDIEQDDTIEKILGQDINDNVRWISVSGLTSNLNTFSSGINVYGDIIQISATTAITNTYSGKLIEASGTITLTLGNTFIVGEKLMIINVGSGTITINASGTLQTKGGANEIVDQYGAASFYYAGSNIWRGFGDLT